MGKEEREGTGRKSDKNKLFEKCYNETFFFGMSIIKERKDFSGLFKGRLVDWKDSEPKSCICKCFSVSSSVFPFKFFLFPLEFIFSFHLLAVHILR